MKNLQVSYFDLEGNRFNGHDLHLYLRERGIDSSQIVWSKSSDDIHTKNLPFDVEESRSLKHYFDTFELNNSLQSVVYPFSYELLKHPGFLHADVVHYHLIHTGYFSLTSLPLLSYLKPTVYTIHDPWIITGHCIHSFDCNRFEDNCGNCPYLTTEFALKRDTSSLNRMIKEIYLKSSHFEPVVASKWMHSLLKRSPIFKEREIHVIPFGVNNKVFKVLNKTELRRKYDIQNDLVISFRSTLWKLKSLDLIKNTLARIPEPLAKKITLLTFNDIGLIDELKSKFDVKEFGWINDEQQMAELYNCSDIFLMPSLAESFGMMTVEAMSCGNTVMVFRKTALEEIVDFGKCGIPVDYNDAEMFFQELMAVLQDKNRRIKLGEAAVRHINTSYLLENYIRKIITLYGHTIEKYSKVDERRKNFILDQLQKDNPDPGSPPPFTAASVKDTPELTEFHNILVTGTSYFYNKKFYRLIIQRILLPVIRKLKNIHFMRIHAKNQ